MTILFADLHGFLDNMKSTWELLKHRTAFYEFIIKGRSSRRRLTPPTPRANVAPVLVSEMLKVCGVSLDQLKFVRGTDYQLGPKYTTDVFKLSAAVTTDASKKVLRGFAFSGDFAGF